MRTKDKPVLFAPLDPDLHAALRRIAFEEKRSMAEVAREAVAEFVESRRTSSPRRTAATRDDDPAARAQGFLRRRARGRDLVGELLRERRAEVRREVRK